MSKSVLNEMNSKCDGCKNRGVYICTRPIKCENNSEYRPKNDK